MAGNGEEAGRTGPEGADWGLDRMGWLRDLTDEAIITVQLEDLTPGDVVAADRRARAITNLARAVKAVVALEAIGARSGATDDTEDGMSENRAPDPERVAAKRAELVRRLTGLQAILEQKRAPRGHTGGDAGPVSGGDAGSGGPSGGAAVGLADLGDAGRPGGGQDLRGGLLAA